MGGRKISKESRRDQPGIHNLMRLCKDDRELRVAMANLDVDRQSQEKKQLERDKWKSAGSRSRKHGRL